MGELTLEESIKQILPTLPLPIQKFFEQRKLGETARLFMERYALHIDQGTVLERELMLVLLGLEGPDEFAEALYKELPVSKQTVLDIIADLNREVFVPLREEMRKATGGPPRPAATRQPEGVIEPPPQSPSYFHLENKLPLTRPALGPLNTGRQPAPSPAPLPPRPPAPRADASVGSPTHQMASGQPASKLLEDHEEPHIEIRDKVQGASTPIIPPSVSAPLKPSNLPLTPPQNLPDALPPPAPVKSYSTDPYREPIDER